MMKYFLVLFFGVIFLFIPSSCQFDDQEAFLSDELAVKDQSLQKILERGKLIATTDYSSTSYFVYRGEPAGYHFELLHHYARHLGVNLEIVVNNNFSQALNDLWSGNVDIIAQGITVNAESSKKLDFTVPFGKSYFVLVQRKPGIIQTHNHNGIWDAPLIKSPHELAGKIVVVPEGSESVLRLKTLQNEIGEKIYIVEHPSFCTEKLISMVATGEIDYTISELQTAQVNNIYFPHLDISVPVSFPFDMAWAVSPGSESLKQHLNQWLKEFLPSSLHSNIYRKYFLEPRASVSQYSFTPVRYGRFSTWDEFIRQRSAAYNFDWRLIAALIYEESQFIPDVVSIKGAFGLMQLMPETAEIYGVDIYSTPEEQIEAGLKYLKKLYTFFEDIIPDETERIKFVLAAYNSGLAHVLDARNLAAKYQKNPNVWDDHVDYFMKNKSNPRYYLDPVVRYGYARGEESYDFVNSIIRRWEHYKNTIPQ